MIGCKIKGLFIIGCKEKLYFTMLELGGYSLRSLSWAKRFWGQCVQAELPVLPEFNFAQLHCTCLGEKWKIIGFNERTMARLFWG